MSNYLISKSLFNINENYDFFGGIDNVYANDSFDPLATIVYDSIFQQKEFFNPFNGNRLTNHLIENKNISKRKKQRRQKNP